LAVISLDQRSIDKAINQIANTNNELGRVLSNLASDFDYPTILNAIESITEREHHNG
jgi:hypothetical protein